MLDNCAGSCTTAVACLNTGRNFVCFELDETYFAVGFGRTYEHARTLGRTDVTQSLATY